VKIRALLTASRSRNAARARIPPRHQAQFFREMEMLLSSGVLIVDALDKLKERYPDARTRRILQAVHADVAASRSSFSRALSRFPRIFPPGAVALIEAGEESGTARLAERCRDLSDRIAYAEANRRQLRRACAYPCFVIVLATGLCLLLLTVVFPRLSELLHSLGGHLPPLTQAVLAAAAAARRDWPWAFGLAGGTLAGVAAARRLPKARRRMDEAVCRLPLAGPIYLALTAALLAKLYGSLYGAGKAAPEILQFCAQASGNAAVSHRLQAAALHLASSRASLAEALEQTRIFPPLACLAIEVGEHSGRLGPALERISAYYDAEARRRIDAAIAVINPALTLFVVGGVGVALLSFFQAVYQVVYAAA
jgi:type II secretory pathway component PulF